MNYLVSIEKAEHQQHALATLASQADRGDAIRLQVQSIDNGVSCRLTIDEGVLKVLGKATQNN